jgi:ubiquinol-cytochrome c reductase cytochrome c subunit
VRRALILAAVLLGGVLVVQAAHARPSIVRPSSERALTQRQLGAALFAANCVRCHGQLGQGVVPPDAATATEAGPPVAGTGQQAANFYLRTGAMPIGDPHEQPSRRRPAFDEREIRALVAYVDSLAPGGPPIPRPDPAAGNLAEGLKLFSSHCAGCHQIVAAGGVVTGARVPPLNQSTATQIAEAVRIGPYVMPSFSKKAITDAQLNSIIAYVLYTHDPKDKGGWAIDHLGPFPEGMVAWGIAGVVLVLTCMLLGERLRRR